MNGTEFVAATAAILFVAFLTGWFAHWLISRVSRTTRTGMNDLDQMAQDMHRAEDERDQAVAYYQSREAELTSKITQTNTIVVVTTFIVHLRSNFITEIWTL